MNIQENLNPHSQIATNLKQVETTLRVLEKKYQRPANSVKLLAVSKTKPVEDILAAYSAGQMMFGENYLQEALLKIEELKVTSISELGWHFIGPIQKNKTRQIAENFQWLHSLDRQVIAQRLNDQRPETLPPLQVCIQVNIDNEDSKSGVKVDEIRALAESIADLKLILNYVD